MTEVFPLLLTLLYASGQEKAQKREMRIQVLLTMVQDRLSKDESGELLDRHIHVVATTQELRHSTRNLVSLTRDYLGTEGSLSRALVT